MDCEGRARRGANYEGENRSPAKKGKGGKVGVAQKTPTTKAKKPPATKAKKTPATKAKTPGTVKPKTPKPKALASGAKAPGSRSKPNTAKAASPPPAATNLAPAHLTRGDARAPRLADNPIETDKALDGDDTALVPTINDDTPGGSRGVRNVLNFDSNDDHTVSEDAYAQYARNALREDSPLREDASSAYSRRYPCPHREDGVADDMFQGVMERCASSLCDDGVFVLETGERGMLFQHTALSVFAERMRLNQMRDFPNVVHLERKRHVTWSRNFNCSPAPHFFKKACDDFDSMARATLKDVCRSLGFRSTVLDDLLDNTPLARNADGASELMAVRYDATERGDGRLDGADPHVDRGILTLIVSDKKEGLRVRRRDGSWMNVVLGPGRVAVIPGETLEHALGGAIVATTHSVDLGLTPRHALVYRTKAREDAIVSPATPPNVDKLYPTKSAKALNDLFEETHRSVNNPARSDVGRASAATGGKRKEPATARPPAPAPVLHRGGGGSTIELGVKDTDNSVVHFRVLVFTKFGKIFNAYCERKALQPDAVRFLTFDHMRINPDQTPWDLDFESGDQLMR